MATPDDHGTREEGADGAGTAAAASRSLDASGRKLLLQCAPFSVPAHAHFLRKALAICDPELAIGALHVARREAESAENSASTVELCDSALNILLLCDVRASVERPGQLVRTSAAAGKRRRAHMRSSGWSDTLTVFENLSSLVDVASVHHSPAGDSEVPPCVGAASSEVRGKFRGAVASTDRCHPDALDSVASLPPPPHTTARAARRTCQRPTSTPVVSSTTPASVSWNAPLR
jgi:hypothetical protein